MISDGKYIYWFCETDEWIKCGKIVNGDFIIWYK